MKEYYPLDSAVIVKSKEEWMKFFMRATEISRTVLRRVAH
jgi:hypothetical protein